MLLGCSSTADQVAPAALLVGFLKVFHLLWSAGERMEMLRLQRWGPEQGCGGAGLVFCSFVQKGSWAHYQETSCKGRCDGCITASDVLLIQAT